MDFKLQILCKGYEQILSDEKDRVLKILNEIHSTKFNSVHITDENLCKCVLFVGDGACYEMYVN